MQSGIRIVLLVVVVALGHCPAAVASADHVFPRAPVGALGSLLALKLGPPLHGDLAAVELSLSLVTALLAVATILSRVAPREVVNTPEAVRWQNEIPDGER